MIGILWIFAVTFFVIGLNRIYNCLLVVQAISISSIDYQNKKMTDSFVQALDLHAGRNQEKLELRFVSPKFPYKAEPGEEISVEFRVSLVSGKLAKNVKVWFFVPEEIECMDVASSNIWKQASDFVIPYLTTAQVNITNVSKGKYSRGSLRIKCPKFDGKYNIMYNIFCDSFDSERFLVEILVGDVE